LMRRHACQSISPLAILISEAKSRGAERDAIQRVWWYTEVRLSAQGVDGPGVFYDSDVVYFEPDGRKVVRECSRLAITQSSIAGSGALAGPSAVLNLLRAKENARSNHARASAVVDNDEGNTLFIPIVITSCGGFGPSACAFSRKSSRLLKRTDAG
jgi:hypothetical protein